MSKHENHKSDAEEEYEEFWEHLLLLLLALIPIIAIYGLCLMCYNHKKRIADKREAARGNLRISIFIIQFLLLKFVDAILQATRIRHHSNTLQPQVFTIQNPSSGFLTVSVHSPRPSIDSSTKCPTCNNCIKDTDLPTYGEVHRFHLEIPKTHAEIPKNHLEIPSTS